MANGSGMAPQGHLVHAVGKTKTIWRKPGEKAFGIAQNKPFVTAGDGKYKEYVPGKEVHVTTATCNIFLLLNRRGIPTHFYDRMNDDSYLVRLLLMSPIEIVVRERAFGSYLKRNPNAKEGSAFKQPIVEFFYKNNDMHDPMMIWYPEHQCYRLYHPHEPPEKRGHIGELNAKNDPFIPHSEAEADRLEAIAIETFVVLRDAFKYAHDATLVDFKIECGFDKDRNIYVADQIDGDSCRLWLHGDKHQAVDKDFYRSIAAKGFALPEERERIIRDYRHFAEMTSRFSVL